MADDDRKSQKEKTQRAHNFNVSEDFNLEDVAESEISQQQTPTPKGVSPLGSLDEPPTTPGISAPGSSDKPSIQDTLDRGNYVKALAALILNKETETPLTIGVYGSWGSGKSSFMLQLKELVATKLNCITFNPWRYDDPKELWYALMTQIAGGLDRQFKLWERVEVLLFHSSKGEVNVINNLLTRCQAFFKKAHNWLVGGLGGVHQKEPRGVERGGGICCGAGNHPLFFVPGAGRALWLVRHAFHPCQPPSGVGK